jgi:3-methyladenine DNA glycosylase AlkC
MPKDTTASSGAFKDQLDAAAVGRIGQALVGVEPTFPLEAFRRSATDGLDALELKARVALVAVALQQSLPADFPQAARVIEALIDTELADADDAGWFFLWPVTDWVARAGRAFPAVALELLARLTPYSTGEFAVRPFIDDDPAAALTRFEGWLERDEHVRRLVSEGTRPRLPWAPRLAVAEADPGYAVPLLDRLVDDPSEYVRRSVSNHLNDLAKMDRELTLAVAGGWDERARLATAAGDEVRAERIDWVIRRGLRTLVKAGDPDALRLLGHDPDAAVTVRAFEIATPVVTVGEHAQWNLTLVSDDTRGQHLVLDYAVHLLLANGSAGRKVFKWSTFELAPGEQRVLSKRHSMKPVTIRTYRPGRHLVEVQANGRVIASGSFELLVP